MSPTPTECFDIKFYEKELHKLSTYDYAKEYNLAIFEDISYGYFGPLSLATGFILLFYYIKVPELRKPPGMLIMWQCLTQIAIDFNWTISGIYYYYL